jgi:hypothetical protein
MAQKLNLVLDQGTTFTTSFTVNDDAGLPINFTGYTGNSQIRKHYTSSNAVPFTVSLYSNGTITLTMNAATSGAITAGRYVYDVEVNSGSQVSRVVEGIVTVTPQVTR